MYHFWKGKPCTFAQTNVFHNKEPLKPTKSGQSHGKIDVIFNEIKPIFIFLKLLSIFTAKSSLFSALNFFAYTSHFRVQSLLMLLVKIMHFSVSKSWHKTDDSSQALLKDHPGSKKQVDRILVANAFLWSPDGFTTCKQVHFTWYHIKLRSAAQRQQGGPAKKIDFDGT